MKWKIIQLFETTNQWDYVAYFQYEPHLGTPCRYFFPPFAAPWQQRETVNLWLFVSQN